MFLKEDFDNSENMCSTIKLQIPGNLLQRSCSRPCKSMALNKYCTNINCKYAHSKEELSKRLSSLLDNCASLKELGRRARAEVLSKHLWEKKARDTEKIYNSLNTK